MQTYKNKILNLNVIYILYCDYFCRKYFDSTALLKIKKSKYSLLCKKNLVNLPPNLDENK